MKTVTLEQLQIIADTHGGILESDFLPSIEFEGGNYGFEATEEIFEEGEFYGFKFFGDPKKQSLPHVMKCWSDLTDPAIVGDLLTIERAKQLIGKKIKVSYHDYNNGEIILLLEGMKEQPSNSIGQKKEYRLLFKEEINGKLDNIKSDWIYEWQGIFRRGSGAERLFIEKIF